MKRPVVRVVPSKRSGYPYGAERDPDDTIIQLGRVRVARPRSQRPGRRAAVAVVVPSKRSGYPYGAERDPDDTIN